MSNLTSKLLSIKNDLEDAKIKKAQLEGQQKEHIKRLIEEFECSDIPEAEEKVRILTEEIKEEEANIAQELSKIEEELNAII